MNTPEAILEQATSLLSAALGPSGARTLNDARLVHTMELAERVGRLADAIRVTVAAEVADRSRFELGSAGLSYRLGQRRPQHLIEQLTGVSAAEASRRMRLGALVRQRTSLDGSPIPPLYGQVAAAFTGGEIGVDAAIQITRHLQQAAERCAPDDLLEAEKALVERAGVESADLVGMHARLLRDILDADGAEPRDEDLRRRAYITLGREREGMTPISGLADPISAAKLRGLFAAYSAPRVSPRFRDPDGIAVDASAVENSGTTAPTEVSTGNGPPPDALLPDTRTSGQRNFDILIGVITAGISADRTVSKSRATVVATVRIDDYRAGRGVGWLDGVDEPISAASVRELGCDAERRLLVLGESGEILALGTAARLFSYAQRIALAARDGGCIWPNCTAPPSWCEAHHVIPYEQGGPTDVANRVLLCSAHHHMLHNCDLTLRMVNEVPRLEPPDRLKADGRTWTVGRSRVSMALGP